MSRRDITKRERIRAEELDLDRQLADAGFEVQGISYDEKKVILAMLEESRKSAEEEENQRKQMLKQEEELLNETLKKALPDVEKDESVSSPSKNETSNAVTSGTADIGQEIETHSNCSTPDLLPAPKYSPVKTTINQSPVYSSPAKSVSHQLQSPIHSSAKSLRSEQSPRHSEDMFMFSQNSIKLGVEKGVIENCIETIKVSESEEEDEDISPVKSTTSSRAVSYSPNIKNITPSKQILAVPGISSSTEKSLRGSNAHISPAKPRPSLRKYQSEVVGSASKTKGNENSEAKVSSQPFSSNLQPSLLTRLVDELDRNSIISPVIGQRKLIFPTEKPSNSEDSHTSIQDAEISNSLSVEPICEASPDLISDDETENRSEVPSSREATSLCKDGDRSLSSPPSRVLNGDVMQRRSLKRKISEESGNALSDVENQCPVSVEQVASKRITSDRKNLSFQNLKLNASDDEVGSPCTTTAYSKVTETNVFKGPNLSDSEDEIFNQRATSTNKVTTAEEATKQKDNKSSIFQRDTLSDSDEDLIIQNKKDGKKNINVFITPVSDDITLKRKVAKSENSKKAYFKDKNEDAAHACDRILSMINMYFLTLENYQSTLTEKIKWPEIIKVDRRVKDSLDHPRVSRKPCYVPDTPDLDVHRVTRQKKTTGAIEEDTQNSDGSLPELSTDDSPWYDARKNNANKRPINIGLRRRQAKLAPNDDNVGRSKTPVPSLNVIPESDSEDFDVQPAKVARVSPALRQRAPDTPARKLDSRNIEVSSLSKIDEVEQANFDMGDILNNSQDNESAVERTRVDTSSVNEQSIAVASTSKDIECKPGPSGWKNPTKRQRKTFKLTLDSDEEQLQSSETSSTLIDKSDTISSVSPRNTLAQNSRKNVMNETDMKSKSVPKGKKDPVLFVSSFDSDVNSSAPGKSNSDDDLCIIDSSSMNRLAGGTGRRGKANPVQLKPPPLKLRGARGRERGTAEGGRLRNEGQDSPTPSTSDLVQEDQVSDAKQAEEEVECPLCQHSFPITVIEAHASSCGETGAELEQEPVVNNSRGKRKLPLTDEVDSDIKVTRINKSKREKTPPNKERCHFCNNFIKGGDEYLLHVRDCEEKNMSGSPTMASSVSRTPGQRKNGPLQSIMASSIRRMQDPGQVKQPTSVFDRLEGE